MFSLILAVAVGFPFPKSNPVPDSAGVRATVLYLGPYNYTLKHDPIQFRVTPDGDFLGPHGEIMDDKWIKGCVRAWCAKYKRPKFVPVMLEPAKAKVKTASDAVARLEKFLPKGTRATIYLCQEADD